MLLQCVKVFKTYFDLLKIVQASQWAPGTSVLFLSTLVVARADVYGTTPKPQVTLNIKNGRQKICWL